jgi:hypothetical protein
MADLPPEQDYTQRNKQAAHQYAKMLLERARKLEFLCAGCGATLTPGTRFCPQCGTAVPSRQQADDTCYLEIAAEEAGLPPIGRSILRSMVGGSTLANWRFVGRVTGGGLPDHADVYEAVFQLGYGRPVEFATGLNRDYAQRALNRMHKLVVEDGWKPASPGAYWFSYRYTAGRSVVERLRGRS